MEIKAKDRRLEGEGVLRQCQLAELYILEVFHEICERHGLRYFLTFGTLIGAMRHDGFIPWDDDVDVAMPYDDFKRFVRIAKNELPKSLMLELPKFFGSHVAVSKIRDRSSFFMEKDTAGANPSGIYIDIFPLCKSPRLPKWLNHILISGSRLAWLKAEQERKRPHRGAADLLVSSLMAFLWEAVLAQLLFANWILRMVLPCRVWNYVPGNTWTSNHGITDDDLFPLCRHKFDEAQLNIPRNSDKVLAQTYSNWREMPPPEKRVWHSSIICPAQAPDAPWAMPYGKD